MVGFPALLAGLSPVAATTITNRVRELRGRSKATGDERSRVASAAMHPFGSKRLTRTVGQTTHA